MIQENNKKCIKEGLQIQYNTHHDDDDDTTTTTTATTTTTTATYDSDSGNTK